LLRVALIPPTSEKFVGGAGKFVNTIPGTPPDKNVSSELKTGLREVTFVPKADGLALATTNHLAQLGGISRAVDWPTVPEEFAPCMFGDAAQLALGQPALGPERGFATTQLLCQHLEESRAPVCWD
jgi:hypothetical protein